MTKEVLVLFASQGWDEDMSFIGILDANQPESSIETTSVNLVSDLLGDEYVPLYYETISVRSKAYACIRDEFGDIVGYLEKQTPMKGV